MRILRLESVAGNPEKAGIAFLIDEDRGPPIKVEWSSNQRVDIAKHGRFITMIVIERLRKQGRMETIDRINWNSVRASVIKHVTDWDRKLGEALEARLQVAMVEQETAAGEKRLLH